MVCVDLVGLRLYCPNELDKIKLVGWTIHLFRFESEKQYYLDQLKLHVSVKHLTYGLC